MNEGREIIDPQVELLCQCCAEEAAVIQDNHLGPVCGSCSGRLSYVEHVLMRQRVKGFSQCADPRRLI